MESYSKGKLYSGKNFDIHCDKMLFKNSNLIYVILNSNKNKRRIILN